MPFKTPLPFLIGLLCFIMAVKSKLFRFAVVWFNSAFLLSSIFSLWFPNLGFVRKANIKIYQKCLYIKLHKCNGDTRSQFQEFKINGSLSKAKSYETICLFKSWDTILQIFYGFENPELGSYTPEGWPELNRWAKNPWKTDPVTFNTLTLKAGYQQARKDSGNIGLGGLAA